MAIPSTAIPTPIVAPIFRIQWIDQNGYPTKNAQQFLQQLYSFVVSMSRIVPCNATMASNVITLTELNVAPLITQYADFDTYGFIAPATSTGLLTAKLILNGGSTLATLNIYKTNGSAQATTGDVTSGLQYFLTYVDSLNSGAGGFVLR